MIVAGFAFVVLGVTWGWVLPGASVWGAFLVGLAGGALIVEGGMRR